MATVRVRYQTIEFGDVDIHLRTLRDRQQYDGDDDRAEEAGVSPSSWSLFGVVWEAGRVLAHHMVDYDIRDVRVLEVGCGIGLASHVLNGRRADITATDYHPDAGTFLARNSALNDAPAIPFVQARWEDLNDELGQFDVIIASDVLYEPDHPAMLAAFIERHAKPACEVIIVDANRGWRTRFTTAMEANGYAASSQPIPDGGHRAGAFRGQLTVYVREA